ncbi:MAG: hypothetical protein HY289_04620 [Planctomycetes bacterium]|nr:hypothetical protein [Planctomycetota bacterium]
MYCPYRKRRVKVFLLWHVHQHPVGEEDECLIGIYSSLENAEQAKQRSLRLPGFRDVPDGFGIYPHTVDLDGWTEGYVTDTYEKLLRESIERGDVS